MLVLILQGVVLAYLAIVRPYKSWFCTTFEFCNELFIFVCVLIFTSFLHSSDDGFQVAQDRNEVVNYFWMIHLWICALVAFGCFIFSLVYTLRVLNKEELYEQSKFDDVQESKEPEAMRKENLPENLPMVEEEYPQPKDR